MTAELRALLVTEPTIKASPKKHGVCKKGQSTPCRVLQTLFQKGEAAIEMHTILIVDDSPLIRAGLCRLLKEQDDWEIVGEAENGEEAIDKAEKLRPEVILLDLAMPVMNGLDAARHLRRIVPAARILMLTNHALDGLREAAFAAGVHALHSKDATGQLIGRIHSLLSDAA